MRNNQEYTLYKQLATYLRYQYRNILYHFDPTGLNLSKAQSGMLKAIQNHRGYPDLVIYEPRNGYHGLFIELKRDGERIHKRDGSTATEHIAEQLDCLQELRIRGYKAEIAVGFEEAKNLIDEYLKQPR